MCTENIIPQSFMSMPLRLSRAVDVDGAIETPAVRDAITHVMEGGKEAFDLRSRKYNFQAIATAP